MAFTKVTLTGAIDTIKEGWEAFNTLIDDLAAVTSGKGASQIGVYDSAGYFTGTDVETVLAEEHANNISAVSISNLFNENSSTTTGLTWGYTAGTLRNDNTITSVSAGTMGLSDDATNYVELKLDGTMTTNTTAFTTSRIPIRQITTSGGAQTVSTDKRCFFPVREVPLQVAQGGTGLITLTDHCILVGSGADDITPLGVATNGQIPIGSTGADPVLATITGTANQITITNAAGSITLSIPDNLAVPTVITTPNEGLHILDTDASHDLIIKAGSDLSADRIFTITTGDAARTITVNGNATLNDWFDQAVKQASSPTFNAVTLSGLTAHGIMVGASPVASTAAMTNGELLVGQTGADPLPKPITGDIGIDSDGVSVIREGKVTELMMGASAIAQSKLKTTTGSVSVQCGTETHGYTASLPGGEYGFTLQVKGESNTQVNFEGMYNASMGTSYVTAGARFYNKNSGAAYYGYAQQRYVTSSGEVYWVFIQRDKITKAILATWQSNDHPCFGAGSDPEKVQYPKFPGFDPSKHEIICITPSDDDVKAIRAKAGNDKDFIEVLIEDYEIDEESKPEWPTKAVTVGLPREVEVDGEMVPVQDAPMGTPVTPVKKVIPKPDGIQIKSLKRRVS